MPTVAELEGMRDALIAMRAAGVRVAMVEGLGRVEYQTDADLARASPARPRSVCFSTSKGL